MWIVLAVLYGPFAVVFFQVCIALELLGDGALKVVTAGNCYVCEVCFFGGLSSITLCGLLLWIVLSVVVEM